MQSCFITHRQRPTTLTCLLLTLALLTATTLSNPIRDTSSPKSLNPRMDDPDCDGLQPYPEQASAIRDLHNTTVTTTPDGTGFIMPANSPDAYIVCHGNLPTPGIPGSLIPSLPQSAYTTANNSLALCSSAYGNSTQNAGCSCSAEGAALQCTPVGAGFVSGPDEPKIIGYCAGTGVSWRGACYCASGDEAQKLANGEEGHDGLPVTVEVS